MADSFTWLLRLDERLSVIADEVPSCRLAADIGADHGKLSCWLLAKGQVENMIVSDISKQSRDKARDLFIQYDVLDKTDIKGEDGLFAIKGQQPDVIIIAGMGGGLVSEILSQPVELNGAKLILSAHTELPLVRDALRARGYRIEQEQLVKASGRFYRVITAVPGEQELTPRQRELGINLKDTKTARVKDYLTWQMSISQNWQGDRGENYRRMLKEELDEQSPDSASHLPMD